MIDEVVTRLQSIMRGRRLSAAERLEVARRLLERESVDAADYTIETPSTGREAPARRERACLECGRPLRGKRRHAKYCSDQHSDTHRKRQRRAAS